MRLTLGFVLLLTACGSDNGSQSDTASATGDATSSSDAGQCPDGQLLCDDHCVDPVFDLDNCGTCGNACGENSICDARACVCKSGFDDCAEGAAVSCVDTTTSNDHCGVCGNACGLGHTCDGTDCVLQCDADETACGDTCVDLKTNQEHCDACDIDCGVEGACIASTCYCSGDFTIAGMSPKPNAPSVPASSTIRVTMSCRMAAAGQPIDPLVVNGSRSGRVSGTTTYDGIDIVFVPSAPLRPGERVSVTLRAGAVIGPEASTNKGWVGQFEVATKVGGGTFVPDTVLNADATFGDEGLDLLDGNQVRWATAVDLDHDGDDDIWLQRGGDFGGVAFVLLNTLAGGESTFAFHAPAIVFGRVNDENVDAGPTTVFDADGDGHADDLLEGAEAGSVFVGDDTLTFTTRQHHLGDTWIARPLVGDLDADGDLDLVFIGGEKTTIWKDDGTGHFALHDFSFGAGNSAGQLGDVDRDGDLDYVGSDGGAWLNDGAAYFTHFNPEAMGGTSDLLLRDFNGDGILDELITGGIWLGLGDGTVQLVAEVETGNEPWVEAAAFDFDGDGDLDVVRPGGQLLINNGEGRFTLGAKLDLDLDGTVEVGDFDGDGALDVLNLRQRSGVELWMNRAP